MRRRWIAGVLTLCLLLTACGEAAVPQEEPPQEETVPFVKAVWMPYMQVEALLSSADPAACRRALAAVMEDCVSRGVNTVFFHVRANSDAYYASTAYAPHPSVTPLLAAGFDPLTAAVEEAHARGLALHAWVNPYRIGADASRARIAATFEQDGRYWYDPSADSTRELVLRGVRELLDGYAVDGIHFDDYFYPEGAVPPNEPAAFEQAAYGAYRDGGGRADIADWRRGKVSGLMAAVYQACHARGRTFGISPSYDLDRVREAQYADAAEWLRTKGYADYLCPQLYVGLEHQYAPFAEQLSEWTALPRDASVSLIAGLALYKTGLPEDAYAGNGRREWSAGGSILARQLALVRDSGWDGAALYSHLSFTADGERNAAVVAEETAALQAAWADA